MNVIFASGNQAAMAVKAAKVAIPFVFAIGDDPVDLGLVTSLNRPTLNATGVTFYSVALLGKRLQILNDLVPKDAMIAHLINPRSPSYQAQLIEVQAAARTLGRRVESFGAGAIGDLEKAFAAVVERRAGGLFYSTDPLFSYERRRLIAFAARHALPTVYSGREYAEDGGLMSYGALGFIQDAHRQAGTYVARILKGEKVADLPVIQTYEVRTHNQSQNR